MGASARRAAVWWILIPPSPILDFCGAPVEWTGLTDVYALRCDSWSVNGASGAKARACLAIIAAWSARCGGVVTAGAATSPQVAIVARIAEDAKLPCRVHVPARNSPSPMVLDARAHGAEIVGHRPGYNTNIVYQAHKDAAARPHWIEIPFGMECDYAVRLAAAEARNIHESVTTRARRVVFPVGSGINLAGALWGLPRELPVLGVVVGADPTARLHRWAPHDWESRVSLVRTGTDYNRPHPDTLLGRIELDPYYEAKMLPFLGPRDLVWLVGTRPGGQ